MKYISIDIETTGIDREKCQILSIGAIIEDTANIKPISECPQFHAAIKLQDRQGFYGEPVALAMNAELIGHIAKYATSSQEEKNDIVNMTGMQFLEESEIVSEFYYWLYANEAFVIPDKVDMNLITRHPEYGIVPHINRAPKAVINVAGKNFGTFDKIFLERLPRWKQLIEVRNRILDPAILFVDWTEDRALPGLDLCKRRAQIPGSVTHNALEDAIDVVNVLRTTYKK
jgi:oligoribonuclease